MTSKGNSSFDKLIKHIKTLPLWIKQVLFTEIKQDLEGSNARMTLELLKTEDSLPLFQPNLSFIGNKELETRSRKLQPEAYSLLDGAAKRQRVLEICIHNGWNLEFCTIQLINCMDMELISTPKSMVLNGTIQYLSNRIRLGEYLIKLNKISIDQLDQALRTQKYIEHSVGERTGLAEVLINLGYITTHDTESILFIKEESKKKYIPHESEINDEMNFSTGEFKRISRENIEYKQLVDRLTMENSQLRDQLKKLLKLK